MIKIFFFFLVCFRFVVLTIILAVVEFNKQIECIFLLWQHMIGYLIVIIVSLLLELMISLTALRGSILDTEQRKAIPSLIYIRLGEILLSFFLCFFFFTFDRASILKCKRFMEIFIKNDIKFTLLSCFCFFFLCLKKVVFQDLFILWLYLLPYFFFLSNPYIFIKVTKICYNFSDMVLNLVVPVTIHFFDWFKKKKKRVLL